MALDDSDAPRKLDRWLDRFGEAMRGRDSRKRAFGRLLKYFRTCLLTITVAYSGWLLVALPFLLRVVGERNLTFAFLLYLPQQIWLLPLIPLAGVVLVFHWRLLPLILVTLPLFALLPMGYRFGEPLLPEPAKRPSNSLTILSYNRGQHAGQSLQPFKSATLPDLLMFQEAGSRAAGYQAAEDYQEFPSIAEEAEFVLLSKFPVVGTEPITPPSPDGVGTVAARFEVDWNGRRIAVYGVHLPTPRDVLSYYRRGAFLYGVIGLPGTPFNEKRIANQQFWDDRIEMARFLADRIAADPLPVIVAGDFNAPQPGYIHGIFDDFLDDSHKIAGSGFGFTFPGTTRNPLSLGGPWMRIDHIFYDPEHWKAVAAVAEKDRPSQHRALAAVLEFSE